ncbi:MAG TPA: homoserine kinase, partial [Balneolaceae bacterium]|nr:homoserine kinase [Balneolaceae bacterium]
FAPATVANVGCGFDILGLALNSVGDELTVRKTETPGLTISSIHGAEYLPKEPEKNVATVAVQALIDALEWELDFGLDFELTKKVAPGSGLGSSASSSAAAVFAVNSLLDEPFEKKELVQFAMMGEKAASGVAHADNVAPSILGGFTLVRSYSPLDVIKLDYPKELYVTVVHPQIEVKTSDSKKILRKDIPLHDAITQWGNVGGLVAGLAKGDYDLIGRSLVDVVAEPVRSMLIPYFNEAKEAALNSGALGCSISGSGPSIFALTTNFEQAEEVAKAFSDLYREHSIDAIVYVSSVNPVGAEVIS